MAEGGLVVLVGAGPGDPGLLTLAGKEALEKAQVVLHDRLAGDAVLSLVPESVLRIDVGKASGDHPIPQNEINALMAEHAQAGKRVVRLKGGDPFLFGRGGEEAEYLRELGIPFRVIPGVSSASAVPAVAGIALTHRRLASSVHIVSGHGGGGGNTAMPYRELARLDGTLVFLMGVAALPKICSGLLDAGLAPDTPAALIENGSLASQRRLLSPLSEMPERAAAAGFIPPAVLVVGRVCSLAERLDWTVGLPLRGKRVLAAGSAATAGRLAARLRELGCGVDELACIRQAPLPQPENVWRDLFGYEWVVFTSRFGAGLFFSEMRRRTIDIRRLGMIKFAVVGPGTAEVLRDRGIVPDLEPAGGGGGNLAIELTERVERGPVLLYRARGAERELDARLGEKGVSFEAADAYETRDCEISGAAWRKRLESGGYDAVIVASGSAARSLASLAGAAGYSPPWLLCFGKSAAVNAQALGLSAEAVDPATLEGVAELLLTRWGK
ncbi:MAG: uroporphyrinogen-III C-methyltransferase [Planctomycetota bacterium]|jgi:uroporphyrinogen III methyltransferase/synthase|nr:uroporphyrinogen-III C-methyltransferase [Planctomycetota bacterium]